MSGDANPTQKMVDLVIIGAGPAGLGAALEASALGMRVLVLDEQPAPGGQIYRGISTAPAAHKWRLGSDYAHGQGLTEAFAAACVAHPQLRHQPGARVWQVTPDRDVHYLLSGRSHTVSAREVLVCIGAMERPFPIPGWTLPGVMTAGAGQILLKSASAVPAGPVVLAGCGPLLYLLAWQYLRAGVRIRAIVDSTAVADHRRALAQLGSALRGWRDLLKGLRLLGALRWAGIPFHGGASDFRIEGQDRAQALSFVDRKGRRQQIKADTVLLHQGVVPHTHMTWSVRAEHRWDAGQQCFVPVHDAWGALSVAGLRVAGDGAGIGGARAATASGRLAGLAAAAACGHLDAASRDRLAQPLRRQLARHMSIRPFLEALYRAPDAHRIPEDDEVIVCRCEEQSVGQLKAHVALGAQGPNQAKAFSRCGMGPCQGRLCGLTVTEIMAQATHRTPQEVGFYRVRPPLKPMTLGELAGIAAP